MVVGLEERKLISDFLAFVTAEAATTFMWEKTQRQGRSSRFMVCNWSPSQAGRLAPPSLTEVTEISRQTESTEKGLLPSSHSSHLHKSWESSHGSARPGRRQVRNVVFRLVVEDKDTS